MPRIDAARLIRAARVGRRLGERGRQGAVLASVTGEALSDSGFLDVAATQGDPERTMGLVLSFPQDEVRAFTLTQTAALRMMAAAGFRFALDNVTDLDVDFAELKAKGFEFIKIDAPLFLDGLASSKGRIPTSEICRHLGDLGLTLIVSRIEDDWLLARILGFGVLFGKGTLFGPPKVVKPEVVGEAVAA
jgi:cyclic-di-GMP phosphodiesterase TipF (flagellum assembly factor)